MAAWFKGLGMPGWLVLMGAITAIGPVSVDMYLPAFPAIAASLGATSGQVERTLAVYLAGMALAQIFYGPLADRYGRKPPLFAGLALYMAASAGCALAQSVEMLTICRVAQAMGGAAGMVIPRAVIRDHFDTQEAARALSMLMLIMGVAPILAPLAGGQILLFTGWRGTFVFMTLGALALLLLASRMMTESLKPERVIPLSAGNILRTYAILLRDRRFCAYAFSGGMGSAGMFGYIVASPRVFIEHFGVAPQYYGFLFGLNAACLIIGSQVNARLLRKLRPEQILPWVLRAMMAAGLTSLALALLGWTTLPVMIGCLMAFLCSQGFVNPNSAAMALADHGRHLGSASAMLGTLTISCGALSGLLVSLWQTDSPMPLSIVLGLCGSLAWLAGRIARRTCLNP
jgi:DHA1 family bicyclomycin/chloramphenicol resistance-like MFS transporter